MTLKTNQISVEEYLKKKVNFIKHTEHIISLNKELLNSHYILILTEWSEFKSLDWVEISNVSKVYDGRNIINKSKMIYQIGI